jgi:F420H(2)-dependent quinone reductase
MVSQVAPRRWQRILQVLPASRLGAWIFSYRLHHVDRPLFRLSNGRLSVPGVLTGLPVVMLKTVGAKSGRPRTVPLVGIRDGDNVVIRGHAHPSRRRRNLHCPRSDSRGTRTVLEERR